jgi:hypothetical protein
MNAVQKLHPEKAAPELDAARHIAGVLPGLVGRAFEAGLGDLATLLAMAAHEAEEQHERLAPAFAA